MKERKLVNYRQAPPKLLKNGPRMNKLSFTLLPLVFWTSCLSSKQQDLWQGRPPPGEIPVVQAGGDPRGRALDPLRITDVACPTLTVYKPAHPDGRAIVVCPGGAYSKLSVVKDGLHVGERFNRDGITIFVLNYRVPVKLTNSAEAAPRQDLAEALRQARDEMKSLGFPQAKVGVMGFSAGGHLALAGAYGKIPEGAPRPDFVIAVYPAYLVNGKKESLIEKDFSFSAASPPACFIHSSDDYCLPDGSVLIWKHLQEFKVPAEMHIFRSGGHGYGISDESLGHSAHNWPDIALDWMHFEPAAGGVQTPTAKP